MNPLVKITRSKPKEYQKVTTYARSFLWQKDASGKGIANAVTSVDYCRIPADEGQSWECVVCWNTPDAIYFERWASIAVLTDYVTKRSRMLRGVPLTESLVWNSVSYLFPID